MSTKTNAPVDVRGLVEKLAAHVRPTCSELWDEAQAFLAQQPTEDADAVSAGGWYQGGERTCGPNATTFRFIRDDNGIVAFVEGSRDVAMKRAARIVECVNACTGIADPAAFIRLAKQAGAAGHLDRKRFERAPCYLCGYNGEGYYQPDKHPCAARYHAQQPAAVDEFAADRERLLRAFMMECGIIGAKEAGVNLARGIKAALAAQQQGGRTDG